MINWLLRVFKDLHTRDDAVALGNQLLGHKIFTHVNRYHEFRDGHFLYQISSAHRTTDYPDSGGFFSKPLGRSVPSTPLGEQKQSPAVPTLHAEPDSSENVRTPVLGATDQKKKKEVLLSQKLQYNVDSGAKSSQLEIVNLHYGQCYRKFVFPQLTATLQIASIIQRTAITSGWTGPTRRRNLSEKPWLDGLLWSRVTVSSSYNYLSKRPVGFTTSILSTR